MPDSFNMVHRRTIITQVDRYRLPAMYYFPFFARDGGLISCGPDEADMFRHAAGYVDRILKGTKAGDLPVQQPTKYQLVINLRTAKALGFTALAPPILLRLALCRWRIRIFYLQPKRQAAPAINRAELLGDNTFTAEPTSLAKHKRTVLLSNAH
jgi:ABC transporter substrate binding protein